MVRTLIVTGASTGIGLETTKRLLDCGHRVIGIARNFSRTEIHAQDFLPLSLDLADLSALPEAFAQLAKAHPEIDGLVCCAGQGRFGGIETFSVAQIQGLIDLNLTSPCLLVRALMPGLKKSKAADIVFLGSEAALVGGGQGAVYSATKFALRGFAQALRQECAKSAVRVTMINPGMVKTDFFEGLSFSPGSDAENYIEAEDVAEAIITALEMRRGTVIDEINLSPLKKVIVHRPQGDRRKTSLKPKLPKT